MRINTFDLPNCAPSICAAFSISTHLPKSPYISSDESHNMAYLNIKSEMCNVNLCTIPISKYTN